MFVRVIKISWSFSDNVTLLLLAVVEIHSIHRGQTHDADTPSRMTENERSDVREMFSGFFRTIDIWEEACFCF